MADDVQKSSHSSSWPYPAITRERRSYHASQQLSRSDNFPGLPQENFAHAISIDPTTTNRKIQLKKKKRQNVNE